MSAAQLSRGAGRQYQKGVICQMIAVPMEPEKRSLCNPPAGVISCSAPKNGPRLPLRLPAPLTGQKGPGPAESNWPFAPAFARSATRSTFTVRRHPKQEHASLHETAGKSKTRCAIEADSRSVLSVGQNNHHQRALTLRALATPCVRARSWQRRDLESARAPTDRSRCLPLGLLASTATLPRR